MTHQKNNTPLSRSEGFSRPRREITIPQFRVINISDFKAQKWVFRGWGKDELSGMYKREGLPVVFLWKSNKMYDMRDQMPKTNNRQLKRSLYKLGK